jgi:hypothetical protein
MLGTQGGEAIKAVVVLKEGKSLGANSMQNNLCVVVYLYGGISFRISFSRSKISSPCSASSTFADQRLTFVLIDT